MNSLVAERSQLIAAKTALEQRLGIYSMQMGPGQMPAQPVGSLPVVPTAANQPGPDSTSPHLTTATPPIASSSDGNKSPSASPTEQADTELYFPFYKF